MQWTPTEPTMILAAVLCLAPVMSSCDAWVFRGVVPQDAPVVSVAVWESRAFLAVPRVWRDPRGPQGAQYTFLHDGPTLLVAPWPEPGQREPCLQSNATLAMRVSRVRAMLRRTSAPRAFPTLEEQALARPDCLQCATAVALECARGAARLWVLDSGEVPTHELAPGAGPGRARCPPKVVVYNLRGNNQRVWTRPFDGVPSSAVSGLAVDPTPQDTRAYVGYPDAPGGAALIVLSWKNKAFWQVRLQGMAAPAPQPRPGTTPPPAGRRGRGSRRRLPRQAPMPDRQALPRFAPSSQWDVAVLRAAAASKRPRMVIAPRDSPFMFDVTLDALRGPAPDANHRNDALVPASELGARRLVRKPGAGPSSGLLSDPSGGLLFFQAGGGPDGGAGGAVIRWDPRWGAGPRGYAVVHRDNGTLPLTSAVFLDGQGAAWAACTTFASHHHDDGGVHHAEDDEDYDSVEHDDDVYDDDDMVPDQEDHDDLEIEHYDDEDHVDTPAPPFARRSNSCRFPRAVMGWKIKKTAGECQDDASKRPASHPDEHAAEPQQYVCMSPDVPQATGTSGPSRRAAARGRGVVTDDDPNTIMITRRAGLGDGSGLRTAPGYHKTVLVHDGDAHGHPNGRAARRRRPDSTHCVRLHWEEAGPE